MLNACFWRWVNMTDNKCLFISRKCPDMAMKNDWLNSQQLRLLLGVSLHSKCFLLLYYNYIAIIVFNAMICAYHRPNTVYLHSHNCEYCAKDIKNRTVIDDRERKKEWKIKKKKKGKGEKEKRKRGKRKGDKRESIIPGNEDAYTGDYKGVRLLSTHLWTGKDPGCSYSWEVRVSSFSRLCREKHSFPGHSFQSYQATAINIRTPLWFHILTVLLSTDQYWSDKFGNVGYLWVWNI